MPVERELTLADYLQRILDNKALLAKPRKNCDGRKGP
jgi:hypothetical protein